MALNMLYISLNGRYGNDKDDQKIFILLLVEYPCIKICTYPYDVHAD